MLVSETRSGIVENTHTGVVCCVQCAEDSSEWTVLHARGDTKQLFYPRSCLKYAQVLPLLESGAAEHFGFTDDEVAVVCASHNSEPCHLATVRGILEKTGIAEASLQCGGHTPVSEAAAFGYVRGGAPTPFVDHIYNNCSGKHAGFLALAKFLQEPLIGYLAPSHRVQRLVKAAVCDVFCLDEVSVHLGIDGCNAPNYAMNARQAAIGYARLSAPDKFFRDNPRRLAAVSRMISAVTSHSYMVYGEDGYCSELMSNTKGAVIGKRGAGGVYMAAVVRRGVGCAVKLDSGAMGPQYCVAQAFLDWYQSRLPAACYCQKTTTSEVTHAVSEHVKAGAGGLLQSCSSCAEASRSLQHFKKAPLRNAMGLLIGHMMCPEAVFDSCEDAAGDTACA